VNYLISSVVDWNITSIDLRAWPRTRSTLYDALRPPTAPRETAPGSTSNRPRPERSDRVEARAALRHSDRRVTEEAADGSGTAASLPRRGSRHPRQPAFSASINRASSCRRRMVASRVRAHSNIASSRPARTSSRSGLATVLQAELAATLSGALGGGGRRRKCPETAGDCSGPCANETGDGVFKSRPSRPRNLRGPLGKFYGPDTAWRWGRRSS
jgi:hypothetical protein